MKNEDSFDLELEKLNEGKLPDSHVFNLGKPGEILQNCGFPAEHRIELAASRLRMKANQGNHPFDILDIKGLTKALQEPVAVFEYGDKNKSQNVIVNLEKDGKNFLVGVFFNQIRDGFEVSSIRGLFNRDNMDWMHWIQQGKMIYGNKEKIQVLAEQQRTNLADVYSKEARTSSDSYYLDSVDNILQSFGDVKDIYTKDFPKYEEQKERFEIFKKFRNAYKKTETINVLDVVKEADEFYDALKSNNKEVIARYTDTVENPELADAVEAISTVHSVINTNGRSQPDPRFSSDNILTKTELVNKTTSTLVIDSNQAARIKVAREIKENMPNLSEKERTAAIAILEAGAKSQGLEFSEYVEKTFPDGIFGDIKKAESAAKQQGIKINGAVSVNGFGENVKAVIYAGKTADFSTWCHELSHIWQAQLTGELKQNAEEAFQVKDSDWQNSVYTFQDGHTDTSAEAFAYGFEDFLKNKAGEMATEDKKGIFEKFADYMSRTYNGVKQHIEINEKIASVYQKFVELDDNILAQAEKAVQMEKNAKLGIPEAERQREVVKKLYQDTDKWLKAPNGNPTKLSEEQWIAVRTPNFKRWFGNWEFNENKIVKTVELNDSEVEFNHNNASEVEKWLKENLSGKSIIIDSSGAKVLIFNKGLKDSLKRHGEIQRNSYAVFEDLISKSELFDFIKSDGKSKHNGLLGQDVYYSALKVGKNYYSVQFKFDVSEKYRTDSYKDHKIMEIKTAPLLYHGSKDAHAITSAVHDFTISQLTNGVKPNFSKMIDENGEPLVVYHGSPNKGSGKDLYITVGTILHSPADKETSNFFKDIGFSGIEYPAGTVFGNGQNAVNYVIFNDEDIKIKEHFQFQIIGENGAFKLDQSEKNNFRIENLKIAQEMAAKGKDEKSIRFATGWEKGVDNKWRYEIDDSKYSFDLINKTKNFERDNPRYIELVKKSSNRYNGGEELSDQEWDELDKFSDIVFDEYYDAKQVWLTDVLDAPELYKAYPQLKDVTVVFDNNRYSPTLGSYTKIKYLDSNKTGALIKLNGQPGSSDEERYNATMLHEIQHIIQDIEGFAYGGAPEQFVEDDKENAFEKYSSLAGEVESRNVESRMNMTQEERKDILLSATEDIPRNNQIIQFPKQKEDIIMESTENLESQEYWKKQFQQENAETFKAIDDYLDKGIRPKGEIFSFNKAPKILKFSGISENTIQFSTKVINKAKNTHNLTNEEIKSALINIASPVLIFDSDKNSSENKENSVLLIANSMASSNKPLAITLNMNVNAEVGRKEIIINEIRSIHDRTLIAKNGTDLIQKWTENELCRYVDDKKISEWSKAAGVQFPLAGLQSDTNNILSESNIVNGKKISNLVKEREDSFLLPLAKLDKNNISISSNIVNDKKISERQLAAGEQFPLAVLHSDTDNILSESNIVNGTTYQKIQTFSKFTEQQKNMEKEYQEYLGTISPDEESSRRIDSGEIFGKFEHQQAKEELNVSTYKFQSGENLDEIIQGNSDFPTETALLDNMIDGNIREVYEYATNEEKTVLRQFAAFRNDYDTDMKNLTVQTDCVSRWIAAKHWNPEMQEFQEDYVNHAAVAEFPYKLPWEMKEIEAQVLQTENETIDKGIESIQVNGGMSEAAMEADYEATEKENIPELKIYHTLKKDDVRNLEVISDQEFSDIVDSIILNDYKNIPNAIRLPNLNEQLSEKLGLEKDSAFILKKNATHIRPDRKGGYGQAFDAEEYRKIPEILRNADFAVVDTVFQNFQIVFDDKNDGTKINKLVFNKDELGNYLVTLGKVDRESAFSEERNPVVAVGVAPTIQTLRTSASSTALRASTTTVDESIAQSKEKATEFVVSKLKSAGIEIISDKDEFENTLAELKGNDEIIQRMAESFEKSEKLRPDNNSVLRANEEVRNILTESLDKTAEPLKEVVYSRENYVKIFEDGVIQSPVETIKMGTNQFVRLCPPDRNNLMGAIYETITKPSIVLEKETFDEKSESFKPVHVYGKSFINQDNDHKRAVESIIVFKDGQNIAASLHNKTISALVKQIKTADDIIYLDKEVSRVATFSLKAGDSHVVKETEEFLSSAGQKSLPLWNKSYDTGKILSISDLIAKGEIEGGKLEITKDNFDKYFNIFNHNIRSYKDRPNKISSDLFSFYVKPENKPEMKQWLESQGYKINENQRAEKAVLSEYTVSDGTTYGFAYNGKIYLNPDFTDSNVAVHEYTHLWDEYTKNTNPELWEKGKDIFKETHIWQEVKNDPNYSDISNNDDLVLSEVHARICGTMSQEVLERIANEEGEIVKDRAIDWNKEVNEYLFSEHGLFAKENLENERLFIEEFMSLPVKDLLNENRELKLRGQSQDELGNYRVTLGKVEAADFNSKNYTKVAVGVEPTIWRVQNEHPIATMLRSSTTLATEETIPQVVEKSINEEKTKMPDQLIYAAAEVGQVIEQRTPEAQSIVNPTRVDRLSTISVPLNKEYNEDFPLSTEKNMSETQKSINEQKTKLQILDQEDKEQLEAMVMTARETIKESLAQDAVPLVEIEFSKANYDRLFPRAIVQTPIETVKLGENQFEKLDAKDRKRFLLATFQTLATPDLVIDEEREGSHSHNYIKSFIFDEKTKAVQDVVVNINGENISITAHPRDINNVVNKIKMPDQLVYAAARVGQVIEQRVQNELGIVNPTRADRLSTISVPLNKEYNMENALSIISEFQTFKGQKTESEFQKKIDEMKKTIEARNMQEVETVTSEKKAPAKKQTTRTKADIIKQAAKDFSEAIKDGLAPFFDTKDDFQKIIMRPSAIVNAANGRPFSGESQLLAQIYHQRQKMEGEIVTSIAGAKSAGTKVLDTPESRQKNFALTDTSVLAEKNSIIRTRYFMPESCEEPEKIYSQTLQQQRPEKIRSYRDLIRHFENIPNGQKEISDIRIRIAHEHLKEIQSRFAIKEEKTLSVEEIEERKNFLRNYFERLPADYRDSERGAFEDTFGIQLDPEKTLKINLQRNFKDIDFAELKENTKKSIELENRKLNNFIEKNTMENKKLASIFKDEYKTQVKEEKQTSKNLKIEAIGIKEPETFLGKYLAACNSNAEFVTDKDTVEQVKKNLEKKLEENFKLEKYDILKEIGQQAQSISNETTKQISFEKAHSNKKNLGKAVDISAEISPLGMGK